jgi:hypothetical protein
MGAYDNPAQLVDRQSGQMIGKAIASIGQNIASGMVNAEKIKAKGLAEYKKTQEANNLITTTQDLKATTRSNDINQILTDSGMKGPDIEQFQKSIAGSLTSYKEALVRVNQNAKKRNYKGKDEDFETIRRSEKFYKNLPSLLESNQAALLAAKEAYASGESASDSNPLFRNLVGVGDRTAEGSLGYNLVINPTTGDYDMNMIATGPGVKQTNKILAGDEYKIPTNFDANDFQQSEDGKLVHKGLERGNNLVFPGLGEEGRGQGGTMTSKDYFYDPNKTFSGYVSGEVYEEEKEYSNSYTVSMTELANTYNNPDNENNNRFYSTKLNVDNSIMKVWEAKGLDSENKTGDGTPFLGGTTNLQPQYNSEPISTRTQSKTVKGGYTTQDVTVPKSEELYALSIDAASRQWNDISTRPNGNKTLQSIILNDPDVTQKDGKYYYNVKGAPGSGVMYTTNADLRDSNGDLTEDETQVEILLPEFNVDDKNPNSYTQDSETSIQNYLTHKAFLLTGALTPPKVIPGSQESFEPEEVETKPTNQFKPMISDLNRFTGTTLSMDEVISNINTFEPDGTKAFNTKDALSFYRKGLKNMNEEDKLDVQGMINQLESMEMKDGDDNVTGYEPGVFIYYEDEKKLSRMNGFGKGDNRISKQTYANKITNRFDTMTEQKDYRVGFIEGTAQNPTQIAAQLKMAERGLKISESKEEKAKYERQIKELKALQ